MSHHKTKLTVKRDPGQACVVADLYILEHIVELYNYMGDSCDTAEKDSWYATASLFSEWIAKTYLPVEDSANGEFS